jgi:tetratricopeptide (TPR) repeat protein
MDKKIAIISILLIAALGFVVYAPSINGKFIYDDKFLVKENTYVKSWANIGKAFTQDIGSGADQPFSFYRPLQLVTYMLDYSIWGLREFGYHLTNIILHVLASISVYWFVAVLLGNPLVSLITALLFVAHPLHTEAICYISGRADPLSTIFFMLAFIYYIKQTRKDDLAYFILMILSYALSFLSRETCVILPALALLYHYAFKVKIKWKLFIPIAAMAVLYVISRYTVLAFLIKDLPIHTTALQRIPGFFVALAGYMRILFWPLDLHMEYGAPIFPWNYFQVYIGIGVLVTILAILAWKRRSTVTFFGIAWFLIALAPVTNIYAINAFMAEHWLYVPCIGVFILMANGIAWLSEKKNLRMIAALIIAALLIFYSAVTIRQNEYWKDPVSFYERTLKYIKWNPKLYDNMGDALCAAGRDNEAIPYFQRAVELEPRYAGAYSNLGNVYFKQAKYEDAFALYKKAVEIKPDFALGYNNLGNVCVVMGKYDEALAYYAKVIELAPNNPGVYSNMGLVYKIQGKMADAEISMNKAIAINPDFALPHSLLAHLYFENGRKDLAVKYYEKAVSLGQPRDLVFEEELKK